MLFETKLLIFRKGTMRLWLLFGLLATLQAFGDRGGEIYTKHCLSCHGDKGQGVADEYDESLIGTKSIASLAKYIHRRMPEEDEDAVIDKDAHLVAQYIHAAFYSPEAQAKIKPLRKILLRRTRYQHRRAITDIVQSFRGRAQLGTKNGLSGHYYHKEKMDDRKKELVKRIDPGIDFDIEKDHKVKGIDPEAHAIFWTGSLLPKESGIYSFRATTPNGVRIFINEIEREKFYGGETHRKTAFIDAWVSSGNKTRSVEASIFLLGGHPVPIYIDFVSYQEKKSSLLIEWKPPHGKWEPIPTRVLFTESAPTAAIVSTAFPPDDASSGYERGSSISKAWKASAVEAAIEAARQIHNDINVLAKTNSKDKQRESKLKSFCFKFATRAFARPLSSTQKKLYIDDIFHADKDSETATRRSLMLILTSPYFLYPSLNRDDNGKSDHYTVAAHLALSLWDSVPDKELWEAAEQKRLGQETEINNQLSRMMTDFRTKAKTRSFFYHWLSLSEKEDLEKDPELFPDFDNRMIADLRTSLDLFIENVVWSEQSDYRKLFTENKIYLNKRLANFYSAPPPAHDDFEPLLTPDKKRAGLFTHPYVLTAFSYHKQTSPIHRGVYLSRNILGRFLKPPPNAIEFKDADFKPNLTMREKVTNLTKDENCMACHSIINPIGFSLENYDATGRFRTHEKDKPINTISEYPTPEDSMVKITGPDDLARLAVESSGAHRAFLKHLFHHLIKQPINAYGFQTMNSLHKAFLDNNFHIQNMIMSMVRETVPR